jgi:uncharacterized protein (DUF924 family)
MTHEKQEKVLSFWFGDDSLRAPNRRDLWFGATLEFDRLVTSRFDSMVEEAASGAFEDWVKTPRGALALVLLLDQFPRHIHRGDPQAFANDEHARKIAETAIDRGFDRHLSALECIFLFLPLEHSEDPTPQNRVVGLFSSLLETAPEHEKKIVAEALVYATRHRDCIRKFGRFPHRNAVLGREDTLEEREFLKRPDSRF